MRYSKSDAVVDATDLLYMDDFDMRIVASHSTLHYRCRSVKLTETRH